MWGILRLSADSDFSSLNAQLRSLNREVAVVTVGRPNHRGMAALLAHGTHHLVYDQTAIDACGPAAIQQVVNTLDSEALATGVRTNVIMARLREHLPEVSHQDLGFSSASLMLEACLPENLDIRGGVVSLHHSIAPDSAADETTDNAAATALRKVGIKPRPHTLHDLRAWLSTTEEPTQAAAIDALTRQGHSKSAIRDCWRLLVQSEAAILDEGDDDVPIFDRAMLGLEDDADTRMVIFGVERLEGEGRNLSQEEVARVGLAILGAPRVTPELLASVHERVTAVAAASK